MRFKSILLLFYTYFLLITTVVAQHPYFYNINNENGLPSNEIYQLKQDDFGFIWIGCDAGLFRYDGFTYKKYSNNQQNGRGISFLQFDKENKLWGKNFFGQIYRVENDSLKIIYQINTSNPSAPLFTIEGTDLWTVNNDTIFKINTKGNVIETLNLRGFFNEDQLIDIKYFNHKLYLFTQKLNIFNINSKGEIESFYSNNNSKQYRNIRYADQKDKLYLLCEYDQSNPNNDIFKIENDTVKQLEYTYDLSTKNRVYSIFCNNNEVWLTTSNGVLKVNGTKTSYNQLLFSNQKISSMIIDREGMYWYSSLHNGLFIVPTHDIININYSNSNLNEVNISIVKKQFNNKLLLGSYNGNLLEYDFKKNEIHPIFNNSQEQFINVKTIFENDDYIIVSRGRLCIIDKKTKRQYFPKFSNVRDLEILEDTVYLVHPNMINKIWINDLVQNKLEKLIVVTEKGGKSIALDTTNNLLYFSLSDGTYQLNKNNEWKEILSSNRKINSSSILYKNNTIWVSSVSDGIYTLKDAVITNHYAINNQLLENEVRVINVTDKFLWVSTENYLHRIEFHTNKLDVFDFTSGINTKDINSIEEFDDYLILGTNKGLMYFPQNLTISNIKNPSIKIDKISLNNKIINYTKKLVLDYSNVNLKIYLNSILFRSKGNFVYKYKILGLDDEFSFTPASNQSIQFSHIPSGNYTILIKAVNNQGLESDTITIPISISFPYWQQWWFYISVFILIIVVFGIVFTIRVRVIKQKADYSTKLINSQLTAIKSQMNPHFLFNTLNSLQDLIVKQDIKMTNFYLSKFSSLLRKVLETSSKNEITLKEELEILSAYLELEKLRFGSDFSFTINIDEKIDEDVLKIHPMLIQPFIENAIKHGLLHKKGEKILTIDFKLNNNVICIIDDNGVGRKKSTEINNRNKQKHQSFATEASEIRVELLNAISVKKYDFTIIDKELEAGTRVEINIPYLL